MQSTETTKCSLHFTAKTFNLCPIDTDGGTCAIIWLSVVQNELFGLLSVESQVSSLLLMRPTTIVSSANFTMVFEPCAGKARGSAEWSTVDMTSSVLLSWGRQIGRGPVWVVSWFWGEPGPASWSNLWWWGWVQLGESGVFWHWHDGGGFQVHRDSCLG